MSDKPIGGKSYGSIPHLSNSRVGPGDYHCHEGQERIATVQARDGKDHIIVQEKMDGSNVGIARIDGKLYPLTRKGYIANTSPYSQHHIFYDWVMGLEDNFAFLKDGERVCGEWLLQAHGTIYAHLKSVLYVFDLFRNNQRVGLTEYKERLSNCGFWFAPAIWEGGPIAVADAMSLVGEHGCGLALDGPEGVVYRVYRNDKFDFLCKYVRQDKIDGKYLPEKSGMGNPVFNIDSLFLGERKKQNGKDG